MAFRVLFFLCLGIFMANFSIQNTMVNQGETRCGVWVLWAIISIYLICFQGTRRPGKYQNAPPLRKLYYGLIPVVITLSGCLLLWGHDPRYRSDYFGKEGNMQLGITADEPPYLIGKFYHFRARVLRYYSPQGKKYPVTGNLEVSMAKPQKEIHYGMCFIIRGEIKKIKGNPHPAFFNYAQYEALHYSYLGVFLPSPSISEIPINLGNPFMEWTQRIQHWATKKLDSQIKDTLSRGFIGTLLIGNRNSLGQDILQTFSKTGTVHILSISGMHIALLFGLLSGILSPLKKIPIWGNPIQIIIILIFLWVYAFITGGSAPVMRSAWMITFFSISRLWRRRTQTSQILASSALMQLIISPINLFDVSFQLSYLAIFSLIYFTQLIQNHFPFKNTILKSLSGVLVSSIAAQLGTLPLVLFYFHQYPVYFLIANLFIIPLSSLILYQGVLFFILSLLGIPLPVLVKILSFTIWKMYQLSNWISNLPNSTLEGIYPSFLSLIFLFGMVFCFYSFLKNKKENELWLLAILLGCLMVEHATHNRLDRHRWNIFMYNSKPYGYGFLSQGEYAFIFVYFQNHHKSELIKRLKLDLPTLIRYYSINHLYLPLKPNIAGLGNKKTLHFENWNFISGIRSPHLRIETDSSPRGNCPFFQVISQNYGKDSSLLEIEIMGRKIQSQFFQFSKTGQSHYQKNLEFGPYFYHQYLMK